MQETLEQWQRMQHTQKMWYNY